MPGGAGTRICLITGRPGVGKTSAIRKIAASRSGLHLRGFYTEEIRVAGERRGFRLVTLDGQERVMAHVAFRGPHRVGKYGVDVALVDEVADSVLAARPPADLYLVDEIGKMECLSSRFVGAMRALLDSTRPVLATVAQRGGGFIAEVKHREDVLLWEVTLGNRDEMPDRLLAWLRSTRAVTFAGEAPRSGPSTS